jgi:phenylacetate-coenzyme A ligase PaaK-like adenylate-forming protein
MWLESTMSSARLIEARSSWNRQQVLAHQEQSFRDLLRYVWENSLFYRDYYTDHGIKEADLPELAVGDLPIVTKEILMEGFDRISRDPVLRRDRLERWLHSDAQNPYEDRYVVINTSGSSGSTGIFVYDEAAWTRIGGMIAIRTKSRARINPRNRYRIALYAATHGHFAAVTAIGMLPPVLFDTRLCSVLEPLQETLDTMNRFQPERLHGYPSTLCELAQATLDGKLEIEPESVFTGGEVLTNEAIATIVKAWGTEPCEMYASSESCCLAVKLPGRSDMTLMEDEHIFEILDSREDPVEPGQTGRMVMTALYNRAIPLIRYDMGDFVTRGHLAENEPFDCILRVEGRVNDALPITLKDGSADTLHPIVLSEFFVPGGRKFQFVSETPSRARVRYLAAEDLDLEIRDAFQHLLAMKGADGSTAITVERAQELPVDARTGKYRLVVLPEELRVMNRFSAPVAD